MRTLLFIAMMLIATPVYAQQDTVTVDLAEDHVDITTGFNGATLSLFGVKNGSGNVAVVVTGPKHDMTVRKKEKFFGAWMNSTGITFDDVPVYYSYATSVPEGELAAEATLKANNIGLASIQPESSSWFGQGLRGEYRDALLRNKQAQGLYPGQPNLTKTLSDNFFRADFYLPAHAGLGVYEIKTIYFRNNTVRDVKTTHLRVAQIGTSAQILDFAENYSFIYALLCIVIALFAGWISNRIRYRT
jgi:uncharacterized protein (TIGR02186 family)